MGNDGVMTEAETKSHAAGDDRPPAAPPATTAASVANPLPADRYLNRELSWLDFNSRVLALAEDTSLPLLERANDPVATNPSPALEAVAHERGWRILRLFA